MEVDLPLGWKLLNLERYDGTTDPDEHLDTFLTQANLYTNGDASFLLCFPNVPQRGSIDMVWRSPFKVHR